MDNDSTSSNIDHSAYGNHVFLWWAVWCIAGVTVPVSLRLSGFLNPWSDALKEWFVRPPFNMSAQAFTPNLLALFCFGVGVTMFYTWAVMHVDSMLKRILILFGGAVSTLIFIPVLALWNVFLNTSGTVMALVIAGAGASITCLILKKKKLTGSPKDDHEPA